MARSSDPKFYRPPVIGVTAKVKLFRRTCLLCGHPVAACTLGVLREHQNEHMAYAHPAIAKLVRT